jgi:hypothetical protein
LHYGFDNWVYGIVGYSGFEGEVGGEHVSFRAGFYRFKLAPPQGGQNGDEPGVSKLEFLRSTNNNSWGVGFSEEGVLFGSTANGNPSVYLPIPNRFYEAVRGWSSTVLGGIAGNPKFSPITDKVRQVDFHGAFTAAAGHALYTARTYPREYWNRAAFVNEPTGHLIATFLISPAGSDFRSRIAWNLLASDDEWTAPILAEVGPDGNVWVIDWYNYIVQHNPTPAGFRTGKGNAYLTDLRDKKHGRILRLVYSKAKAEHAISLKGASPQDLVAALKNDNLFWRTHAQRLLVERGANDVIPALLEAANDRSTDEIGLNAGVIHALWALQGLGALDGSNAAAVAGATTDLKHESAGVRRNAALVLPRTVESSRAIVEAGLLKDADGQVRLAALLALAEMPCFTGASAAILSLLEDEKSLREHWLVDAATAAAAAQGLSFLNALVSRQFRAGPREDLLSVIERVSEHYARGAPADTVGPLLVSFSAASVASGVSGAVVAGLARGWPKSAPVRTEPATEEALGRLFETLPPAGQGRLVALASRWAPADKGFGEALKKHAARISASFFSQLKNEGESDSNRLAAARGLVDFMRNDPGVVKELLAILSARTPLELSSGILDAMGQSEAPEAGEALLERMGSMTPAVRQSAVRILLRRAEWSRALLRGVERGDVQLAELSLDQKQSLTSHPNPSIAGEARKLLSRGGGLPSPDRQAVLDQLSPLLDRTGDPALGKLVFQKQCSKCHTHGGEGNKVGPDLTGMAVHPKAELLTQIIDPSRSVEGNYRVYTVVAKDGRIFNGLLASESKTSIELFDSDGKKQVLLREEIEQLVASAKSLMPEGFEKQVSADDLVNLLEFLAQRGKFLPIPLEKAATIVSTQGMFFDEGAFAERLVFPDWSPKTFEGVPFYLVDPQGGRTPNVILLYGPQGKLPPRMPRSVKLPCNAVAKTLHFLSGVSGWGYPGGEKGSVTMIVRLHYGDEKTEDHPLLNGEHFADYIRQVDVPGSKLAFLLRGRQIRYLAIQPKRQQVIREIELLKGPDGTAPVVMALTVEAP